MKSLSASIIVLTGAGLGFGGTFVRHSDSGMFIKFVGFAVLVVGLVGWFRTLQDSDQT